jgi:hypothetical protein
MFLISPTGTDFSLLKNHPSRRTIGKYVLGTTVFKHQITHTHNCLSTSLLNHLIDI